MSAIVEISISPEQLNAAVANAVLESTIGTALKRGLQDYFSSKFNSDYQIKSIIEAEIKSYLTEYIKAGFGERLRVIVREQLTDAVLVEITDKAVQKFLKAY